MKILKKCEDKTTAPAAPIVDISTVPAGTIFRFGDHKFGPYLKLRHGGVVELSNLVLWASSESAVAVAKMSNYKALDNAYLVTGEE